MGMAMRSFVGLVFCAVLTAAYFVSVRAEATQPMPMPQTQPLTTPTAALPSEQVIRDWSGDRRVSVQHIDYDSEPEKYEELLRTGGTPEEVQARSAERFLVRGTAYLNRGQLTRALQDFHRALRLTPADPRIHFRTAQTLVARNRYAEALSSADRALELEPYLHVAYGLRSWCHLRLKNVIASDRDWASFTSMVPGSAGDFAELASERLRRGELELALATANQGLELSARSPNVGIKGIILSKQGKHKEAMDLLKLAVEEQPQTVGLRIHLALILGRLGQDNKEALAEVSRLQTEELR